MYIIYKDIDLYFINLLLDHSEIEILINLSCLNRKYNVIINEILMNMYNNFVEKYNDTKYIITVAAKNSYDINFILSVTYGNMNVSKFIYYRFYKHIDVNDYNIKLPFQIACVYGYLHIAKWMYSLFNKTELIDTKIKYNNICIFSPPYVKEWLLTIL